MSADFILRDSNDPTDPDENIEVRFENTVNTPIVSVTPRNDGRSIGGEYSCEFTESGGSVTVDVTCNPKNTIALATGESVVADGVTANPDMIPGYDVVLSASIVSGWEAEVSVAQRMTASAVISNRLFHGVVTAGTTTTGYQFAFCNTGSSSGQDCEVTILPGFYYTYSAFIDSIFNHTDDTRDKMAISILGDSVLSWSAWADGVGDNAGYKTADFYVGGVKCIDTCRFDGSTIYQYGESNGYIDGTDALPGLGIIFPLTTADPSSASSTLTVTDSYTWVELAPDVSGSPGTYAAGDLTVTETGQAPGVVTASGYGEFWARLAMPASASPGDQRAFNVVLRGLTT